MRPQVEAYGVEVHIKRKLTNGKTEVEIIALDPEGTNMTTHQAYRELDPVNIELGMERDGPAFFVLSGAIKIEEQKKENN